MAKGLRLEVYRRAAGGADCTNGGITAHAPYVTVTGTRFAGQATVIWSPVPDDMQVSEPRPEAPEVILVIRNGGRWLHLEPAEGRAEDSVGLMMGGNYAGSSDSRWTELTKGHDLVAVHDRNETQAQYDYLSV
jgi:hypothetical protein